MRKFTATCGRLCGEKPQDMRNSCVSWTTGEGGLSKSDLEALASSINPTLNPKSNLSQVNIRKFSNTSCKTLSKVKFCSAASSKMNLKPERKRS